MKKIAVLTSGGDAPGMNAAIRAVVRTGLGYGWGVVGVRQGYTGLIEKDFVGLGARDVGGIIHRGGTVLGTSRCPEFRTRSGRLKAIRNLKGEGIDALIVIGGNGSQSGAYALHRERFPVVGVASTIDNDLYGSDITVGVDTALNIALEAIDRLKTTASSHQRAFLVEIMGRNSGYLALMAGIAGGAEAIVVPEVRRTPLWVAEKLKTAYARGKTHALAVVAEGSKLNASELGRFFKKNRQKLGFDVRVTILGHVQRGGIPSAFDRLLSTRLAAAATASVRRGKYGVLMGWIDGALAATPLREIVTRKKAFDADLLKLSEVLAK